MAVDTLLALMLAFLSTVAALLQAIGGTIHMERLLEYHTTLLTNIHQRLIEIRDRR